MCKREKTGAIFLCKILKDRPHAHKGQKRQVGPDPEGPTWHRHEEKTEITVWLVYTMVSLLKNQATGS